MLKILINKSVTKKAQKFKKIFNKIQRISKKGQLIIKAVICKNRIKKIIKKKTYLILEI